MAHRHFQVRRVFETYDHEILRFQPDSRSGACPRLGIIGGGQLARMTALSALQLGCDVLVLERESYSPAARLATHSLVGDWNDPNELLRLAEKVDVVTLENEFADSQGLAAVEEAGHLLFPSAHTLSLVQDKFTQKLELAKAGLPLPRFRAVHTPADVLAAAADLGWPLVLKTRRNGYDGKGNATIRAPDQTEAAWRKLGGGERGLYVEEYCPFSKELAVIVTRARDGALATYPVVETVQRDHICHRVLAPAAVASAVAAEAGTIAATAVAAVQAVGSFGVELFLTEDGAILINELAPRVHNSGHYTIEACACSQFENHVRAVLGLPLGSTALRAPAAAMVNLLGSGYGPGHPLGLERALAVQGAHIHLYGKAMSGTGRKMGHVTALGATPQEAADLAGRAASFIHFGESP